MGKGPAGVPGPAYEAYMWWYGDQPPLIVHNNHPIVCHQPQKVASNTEKFAGKDSAP